MSERQRQRGGQDSFHCWRFYLVSPRVEELAQASIGVDHVYEEIQRHARSREKGKLPEDSFQAFRRVRVRESFVGFASLVSAFRDPVSFFAARQEPARHHGQEIVADMLARERRVELDEVAGGSPLDEHPVDEIVDADISSREHGHLPGIGGFRLVGAFEQ